MYSWGSGRIGHGPISNNVTPTLLHFDKVDSKSKTSTSEPIQQQANAIPKSFVSISAGKAHSLLLDNYNRVWMFGDNSVGQSGSLVYGTWEGQGVTPESVPFPYQIKDLRAIYTGLGNIKMVSAWRNSFIVTDNGGVYGWGPADMIGFQTINNVEVVPIPTQVPFPVHIQFISTSNNHCMAISKDGHCYGWGNSTLGRIGLGEMNTTKKIITPTLIKSLADDQVSIIRVGCGNHHSLFLDTNGFVYSCGYGNPTGFEFIPSNEDGNSKQQQQQTEQQQEEDIEPNSTTGIVIYQPKQLNTLNDIKDISCGFYHNILLDKSGNVFVFGDNQFGQFGNGSIDYEGSYLPCQIDSLNQCGIKAVIVNAGVGHSAVISDTGKLYLFGGALVENEAPKFRMNVALGNGSGGFETAQFFVEPDKPVQLANSTLTAVSYLKNITSKENDEVKVHMEQQDQDTIDTMLSEQGHISEAIDNLTPLLISYNSNQQHNTKLVSCGQYHTLSFTNSNTTNVESLQNLCIDYMSRNILDYTESLQSCSYILPKIDAWLGLKRLHTDETKRLFSGLLGWDEEGSNQPLTSWDSHITLLRDRYQFQNSAIYSTTQKSILSSTINNIDIENISNQLFNNSNTTTNNGENGNNNNIITINSTNYIIIKNDKKSAIGINNNKNIIVIYKTNVLVVICITSSLTPIEVIANINEYTSYLVSCGY